MSNEKMLNEVKLAYTEYINKNAEVKKALYKEAAEAGYNMGVLSGTGLVKQAQDGYGLGALVGTGLLGGAAGYGINEYLSRRKKAEEEAQARLLVEQQALAEQAYAQQQFAYPYGMMGY